MQKLKPVVLRHSVPTNKEKATLVHHPIYLILDGVMDTYNIGSLFRLADATGVTKMYICGEVEYPPNSRIHKAAVGTENWVEWEKRDTALEVVNKLKKQNIKIIAVEQDPRAVDYRLLNKNAWTPDRVRGDKNMTPIAVVVGHETNGVSKEVLDQADIIVELPMYGINNSLNVWGSAAVVLYKILELL